MLYPDERPVAPPPCLGANDARIAARLRTSSGHMHWEWNLDRQEIAVFVRTRAKSDATEPALVCSFDEWLAWVVPSDRQRLRAKLLSLAENATRSFEAQFRVVSPAGSPQWTDLCGVAVRDEQARLIRVVAQQHTIAGACDGKPSPLPSPFHDPLTGLPNRLLFQRCLSDALESARRDIGSRIAILFVDLDDFKSINDGHGHLVGDQTLLAVSRRLSHCLRPEDILARRDGDEFTILAKNVVQQAAAEAIAERIVQHLRLPLALHGREQLVTASVGIALSCAESRTADQLLHDADQAMYRAKARGGNAFEVGGRQHRDRLACGF